MDEGQGNLALSTLKYCYLCKEHKSLDNFRKNASKKDGLHSECKPCDNKRRNDSKKLRDHLIRIKLLDEQENKCAICKKEFTETGCIDHDHSCCGPNKHCISCRRDLLCHRCNTALGLISEDIDTALNMIRYILKWK